VKPTVQAPSPATPPYEANWANYISIPDINPHIRFREASYESLAALRTFADALWAREALKNHPGPSQHLQ
jgi:hypothetical protein